MTPSLGGLPTKAEESLLPMRQTNPRRTPTRYFIVSGRAYRYYTLLKGDLEVVAAKGNLIIPRRNSTTGCSFTSYPGQIFIIIIIIIILLYQRYVLSKLSWHLTVANLAKTWVIENLDSITIRFIRQWLDLPISATLSGIILPCNQFGLNLQLPSVKFIQCQTVLRNSLRSSKSDNIKSLWKSTSCSMNVQYDSYKNTKQILKAVRQKHTEKLRSQLTSQGFIISFLLEHSMKALNSLWSSAQS